MLGFGDQISESIAHFIGYFHTSIEAARARIEYREFKAAPSSDPHFKDILTIQTDPSQRLEPGSFDPDVKFIPVPWAPVGLPVMPWVDTNLDEISVASLRSPHSLAKLHSSGPHFSHGSEQGPFLGSGPSETSVVLQQTNHLEDNDIVIMGSKVPLNIHFADDAAFAHLSASAFSISEPFSSASAPGSGAEMDQFFANQSTFIHAAATGPLAETPGVTVVSGPTIEGLFINGSQVASVPSLNDSLPDLLKQTDHSGTQATVTTSQPMAISGSELAGSVSVQAGANLLVNEVVLQSLDTVSAHFAVAGDYWHINAIVQTNAYSDADSFDNGFSGQQALCQASTIAMNIASFVHHDQVQSTETSNDAHVFPQNWQITIVSGDLIQMNWISQYSFMSDNDLHVLSATGAHTTIVTGGNMAMNSASFTSLCNSYDLVMIGGHYYDGNFIFQTNVLFDNDTFTSGGAAGAYEGKLSTSDNLLWNAASIQSGATTNWVTGLPQHYLDALNGLASGDYKMPDSFHNDQNLQGIEGLRLLYISGNVYDLNYVAQVNILGDADYVAHYEDALKASSDTVWDISTGSNALINIAAIVDSDTHTGGTSYAGGGVYSDAILIQADIIGSPSAAAVAGQVQPLVNEVVAFLDHDADTSSSSHDQAPPIHIPDTTHSVDVMQTVLA